MQHNKQLGDQGEKVALKYLQQKRYQIIRRNFFCKWGEIDLIAVKNNKLYFIEVKTRSTLKKGRPELALTRRKFQSLTRAIYVYLDQHQLQNRSWQIDLLAVLLDYQQAKASVRHIPNIYVDTKYGYKVR